MRRVVALVAIVLAAGCAVRPQEVTGAAVPVTAAPTTSPTAAVRSVTMTGFGLTVTFPVPAAWTVTREDGAELHRTDAAPGDDVLLRIDLTARGQGSARDGAERIEAASTRYRPGYRRLGLADVPGVGDDAVDWSFTHELDGEPVQVVDRQIVDGTGAVAVYLRAPTRSYERYRAVWQRAAAQLVIRTT